MNQVSQFGSEREKQEFLRFLNERQMRDSGMDFTTRTQQCFEACIHQFRTTELDRTERTCIENCGRRSLAFQERATIRFGTYTIYEKASSSLMARVTLAAREYPLRNVQSATHRYYYPLFWTYS